MVDKQFFYCFWFRKRKRAILFRIFRFPYNFNQNIILFFFHFHFHFSLVFRLIESLVCLPIKFFVMFQKHTISSDIGRFYAFSVACIVHRGYFVFFFLISPKTLLRLLLMMWCLNCYSCCCYQSSEFGFLFATVNFHIYLLFRLNATQNVCIVIFVCAHAPSLVRWTTSQRTRANAFINSKQFSENVTISQNFWLVFPFTCARICDTKRFGMQLCLLWITIIIIFGFVKWLQSQNDAEPVGLILSFLVQ